LIELAHQGDNQALTLLVNSNLRIVWSVAKHYLNLGLDFDDLVQEGNIGLMRGIEKYDPNKGTAPSTWFAEQVRCQITKALSEKGRMVKMYDKLRREGNEYQSISMDEPLTNSNGGDDTTTYGDTFKSDMLTDTFSEIEDVKCKINSLMRGLSDKEKAIVCGLFGIGCQECSEYTLAKRFKLTEERVRQIKWEALEKMKQFS